MTKNHFALEEKKNLPSLGEEMCSRLQKDLPEIFEDGKINWHLFHDILEPSSASNGSKNENRKENGEEPAYQPFGLVWGGMDEAKRDVFENTGQKRSAVSTPATQRICRLGEHAECFHRRREFKSVEVVEVIIRG